MPCFEGLLPPPFDGYVLDLLYDLATWLSYAKLRLQTDSTLNSFNAATTSLGTQLRKFAKTTSPHFKTKETPREQAARARRAAAKQAKAAAGAGAPPVPPTPATAKQPSDSKWKIFNLRTYKAHALGDYLISIWLYGTTDSYSTRTVSLDYNTKMNLLTNFLCRGSLSTAESSDFMHALTKIIILANVLVKSVVEGSCKSWKSKGLSPLIPRPFHSLLLNLYPPLLHATTTTSLIHIASRWLFLDGFAPLVMIQQQM